MYLVVVVSRAWLTLLLICFELSWGFFFFSPLRFDCVFFSLHIFCSFSDSLAHYSTIVCCSDRLYCVLYCVWCFRELFFSLYALWSVNSISYFSVQTLTFPHTHTHAHMHACIYIHTSAHTERKFLLQLLTIATAASSFFPHTHMHTHTRTFSSSCFVLCVHELCRVVLHACFILAWLHVFVFVFVCHTVSSLNKCAHSHLLWLSIPFCLVKMSEHELIVVVVQIGLHHILCVCMYKIAASTARVENEKSETAAWFHTKNGLAKQRRAFMTYSMT